MNSRTTTRVNDVRYLGFNCRVVSGEWAELFERDRLEREMGVEERMDGFLRTLDEIRGLPCSR